MKENACYGFVYLSITEKQFPKKSSMLDGFSCCEACQPRCNRIDLIPFFSNCPRETARLNGARETLTSYRAASLSSSPPSLHVVCKRLRTWLRFSGGFWEALGPPEGEEEEKRKAFSEWSQLHGCSSLLGIKLEKENFTPVHAGKNHSHRRDLRCHFFFF